MSDKVAKGFYRFDKSYRKKIAEPSVNKTIEVEHNGKSTIQGYKKLDKELNSYLKPSTDINIRQVKDSNKDIDFKKLEYHIDLQDERRNGWIGGLGGRNEDPDEITKDKELNREVKEDHRYDKALANVINWSSNNSAGNYQGGYNKVDLIKKGSYVDPKLQKSSKKEHNVRIKKRMKKDVQLHK